MMIKFKRCAGMEVLGWIVSIPIALIGLLILMVIFFEARKAYWDNWITEMCRKNGGVTVFKKIYLTKDEYRNLGGENGSISIPVEKYKKGSSYFTRTVTEEIREWNPEVKKRITEIIRSRDGEILGKQITYSRIGGDTPTGILHPSSFSCRDIPDVKLGIERQIFLIKGDMK